MLCSVIVRVTGCVCVGCVYVDVFLGRCIACGVAGIASRVVDVAIGVIRVAAVDVAAFSNVGVVGDIGYVGVAAVNIDIGAVNGGVGSYVSVVEVVVVVGVWCCILL